jgi:hypothetical protein
MKLMKTKDGYQAISMIPFDGERTMRISTMKRYGGELATTASVVTVEGIGFTHMMYQDFSALMEREKVRVTSKAVKEQHERALAKIDAYTKAAWQFYEHKKPE